MKKVLLIIEHGKMGGIEKASLNLIKILEDLNYEIKLLKLKKEEKEVFFYKNEITLVKKIYKNKFINIILQIFKLRNFKIKYKPDLVISSGDYSNTINCMTLLKDKKIGIVHSIKSIEINYQGLYGKFCKIGIKYFYNKFEKIICISQGIKNDLEINFKNIKKEKLIVIYNYHDFSDIKNKSKISLNLKELELFEKNKVLLFLGRLDKIKNTQNILKAFNLIEDKSNLKLVFIGDGPERENLEKLTRELNLKKYVFFLGNKRNPYKYLRMSKALLLASSFEGMPNVIIESLALNIPILTTDCSLGIREALLNKNELLEKITSNKLFLNNGLIIENLFKDKSDIIPRNEKKYSFYIEQIVKMDLKPDNSELLKKFEYKTILNKYRILLNNIKDNKSDKRIF